MWSQTCLHASRTKLLLLDPCWCVGFFPSPFWVPVTNTLIYPVGFPFVARCDEKWRLGSGLGASSHFTSLHFSKSFFACVLSPSVQWLYEPYRIVIILLISCKGDWLLTECPELAYMCVNQRVQFILKTFLITHFKMKPNSLDVFNWTLNRG